MENGKELAFQSAWNINSIRIVVEIKIFEDSLCSSNEGIFWDFLVLES